jgi:hypothetical protein
MNQSINQSDWIENHSPEPIHCNFHPIVIADECYLIVHHKTPYVKTQAEQRSILLAGRITKF